jgi:hypothetical protein
MGLQTVPAYVGVTGYNHPALLDRNILKTAVGKQPGVVGLGDFLPVPTTGLNVSIPAGAAFVKGKDATNQGMYYAWSDAADTVACIAPAGSNRIDALVLRTVDPSYSAGPTPGAVWDWVAGTPGSGTAPTDADIAADYFPGGWLRVANVQINVGDTTVNPARIFDQRTWAINANGIQYISSTAAFPTTDLFAGQRVRHITTGVEYVYTGSAWLELAGPNATRVLAAKSITPGGVSPPTSSVARQLLTNFNLTNVPLVNGRWYRLSYEFMGAINGTEQIWSVLKTGTTTSDGVDLLLTVVLANPSTNSRLRVKASVLYQASATGTMNFTSVIYRNSASATSMSFGGAGSNDPGTFMCEEIGESALVTLI